MDRLIPLIPVTDCQKCAFIHDRCHGHTSAGKPCGLIPPDGSNMCARRHGASAKHVKAAIARRVESAELAIMAETFGTPVTISVLDGLLEEWYRSNGIVRWLYREVQQIQRDKLTSPATAVRGEQENALSAMLREERKHVKALGVDLGRLGIESRQLQMAEDQASLVLGAVARMLESVAVGLSAEQKVAAQEVLVRELTAINV